MTTDRDPPRPDALARFTAPRELIATFADAEARVRQAFGILDEVELTLGQTFLSVKHERRFPIWENDRSPGWCVPEATIQGMRRRAWRTIVERLELRRILSVKRWEQMDKALAEEAMPAITAETVENFVLRWSAEAPKLIEEAIAEVFEFLRPRERSRGARYKTNQKNAALEIGERVVLYGELERWSTTFGWQVRWVHGQRYTGQQFTALENVFRSLDGAGYATPHYQSDMQTAIEKAGTDGRWETAYFAGRCCKNGNLHLTFKRLDLLREFNKRAGERRLRPAA